MLLKEIIIYFEFATVLVALFSYQKHKQLYFKCFVAYVLVVFGFEYLIGNFFEKDNQGIYNIYTFFEFNLVSIIYYNLNKEKLSRLIISYLIGVFNCVYFLSFFFLILQNYTVTIGALIVSVFMIFYLKELLNSDKIIEYKREVSFWITVGMLFYYLCTIPFLALVYFIGLKGIFLFKIINIITIITHLCFIFGLLWSKRTEN
ncbi:MAG: hypothetical protein JKY44_04700 [Flavobacteriaceae bacterium]|nr:hypothetical protein [Flavobacteriaceae bacterium]